MLRKSLLFLFLFLLLSPVYAKAQVTAIRAGRIIDSENGKADINQIMKDGVVIKKVE